MKITLAEPLNITGTVCNKLAEPLLEAGHEFTAFDTLWKDEDELVSRIGDSDIVIIANHPFPASVIERCPNLKMIDVAFTGIDHVGTDACRERNITVCNAAGYSTQSVAELVIAMAVIGVRNLGKANETIRHGGTSAGLGGREIAGRTVGVIGLGAIGMAVARLFTAFGAKVIAFNRSERDEAKALGVVYKSLDEVLQESDIVTLHLPNNSETRGMISKEKIALMKNTAVFINCARGPIVDNKALAAALNNEELGFACLDVFDMEPPLPADYPLLYAKNTFLTPHQGFISEEAMVRRAAIVFDNAIEFTQGSPVNVCKL